MDENKKRQFAEMQKEMLAFQNSYVQSFTSANGDIIGTMNANMEITALTISQNLSARELEQTIRETINKAIVSMGKTVQTAIQDITKKVTSAA